jgi:hypothetical protein
MVPLFVLVPLYKLLLRVSDVCSCFRLCRNYVDAADPDADSGFRASLDMCANGGTLGKKACI